VNILIVEDDPQVRDMLALLLGSRWKISNAEDGETAWTMARTDPPDLIISDVRMPGMDGIALLRRLRAEAVTQNVPVILVSGRAGEQETMAGLEAGADDFLIKPFSARELLVRVQSRLEITAMRRRNAEQQAMLDSLRRHTRWTERLLDSLPIPLFLLQPGSARILFANRASEGTAGMPLPRGSALAAVEGFRLLHDENGAPLAPEELAPTSPEARIKGRRLAWRRRSELYWLLADSELIPELQRHSPVVVLTLRDITALVTQEQELRRAVRARDEFLSTASHELRTPLTTLSLQAEAMVRTPTDDSTSDRLRKRIATIRKQIRRLQQLVETLLNVSRLTDGHMDLHPEEVDLGTVAAEAIDLLREPAEEAGCQIEFHRSEGVMGRWDRLRLGQVVTNLVSNAIKFGGGHPIEVEVATIDKIARLRVKDHGVGVAPEAHKRIFDRFERAASDRHYPGLGLGLWITKQIVEACGGNISIDSQPGKGSTFTVELPPQS
jgi:signal transduction histidine kinase